MARASIFTLLSLDRWARIFGIAPAHFNGAVASSLSPVVFPVKGCDTVWPQHNWQDADKVSREALAMAIQSAEVDIARAVGYWPAPVWLAKEIHVYDRVYRREYFSDGFTIQSMLRSIRTDFAKFVRAGRRAVDLIGTATTVGGTLVYSDNDGDGLEETATITLSTSYTSACYVKVFFAGEGGAQEWEVRPLRSATISGGTLTIVLDAWLLIDPDLWEGYPTDDGMSPVDISTTANYVASVEVYYEYTDFTQASAEFYWEKTSLCSSCGGTGCLDCTLLTQDGCIHVRDTKNGIVIPVPGSYDADDEQWEVQDWSGCRAPDMVKVWYYAGDVDNHFLRGTSCDPLSEFWAQTIAWMAAARLDRNICGCILARERIDELRRDLAFSSSGSGTYFVPPDILANPFGTRRGEVMAWRRIMGLVEKRPHVAVI